MSDRNKKIALLLAVPVLALLAVTIVLLGSPEKPTPRPFTQTDGGREIFILYHPNEQDGYQTAAFLLQGFETGDQIETSAGINPFLTIGETDAGSSFWTYCNHLGQMHEGLEFLVNGEPFEVTYVPIQDWRTLEMRNGQDGVWQLLPPEGSTLDWPWETKVDIWYSELPAGDSSLSSPIQQLTNLSMLEMSVWRFENDAILSFVLAHHPDGEKVAYYQTRQIQ